ncbi:T9SS type B sorting domain-containing protein [Flavobacterium piscinae]|uniref:T9SS type B sorting domain-containing protein n=1 Tax=Flavobacterium piscinae TaxID=2506424 RepID=A0A4Q1KSL4_9FLAO|nr:T9SS type B sorting domain-containing protein [Flavobacterium piscinae]RXR32962.1 T9SS type B sorting domain-containing protein [Flavobacterium piscinae]
MKTKLLNFLLLLPLVCFSQAITVNTTTYTVPELVTNVLVSSPCLDVTNVNWSTGSNFGSSNGIGYFQNTNPNFPMQSGVILSTGNVSNAPGPNNSMLNDGLTTWPGDNDLEVILANAGISMTSTNATVLEFNFTALSPHFDFDFLFASEEYGNFQCQFSDAFAFLLTNLNTGVTTNLAVIPGTNTPISVVTVRDFLYNSSCPSSNAEYFGTFNGGANANLSPINFNGQTVVMNASAVLTPNTPYKIKLVVADRIDPQSDSAIFLSANSFNIGQNVLGEDLTLASNTALCDGESHVINTGLNPSEYTFIWKRNGVILPAETGASLTVTESGIYELTYSNNAFPCQTITDSVLVEFNGVFNTPNPIDILKCDTGAGTYSFNLAINTPIVTAGLNPNTVVSYHSSEAQAHANTSPLANVINSTGNQTVYVRIKKHDGDCYVVKSFQLLVTDPPIVNQIADIVSCEHLTIQDKAWFVFAQSTINAVLGDQNPANFVVTIHRTQEQATNGTNAIGGNQIFTVSTTVYVRVQNATDSSCFSIAPINLVVQQLPDVDSFEDVIVCESYTLEEITNGEYYTGPNGTGEQKFAGDVITETQRIYIYNTLPTEPSCPNESSFLVTIIDPDDISLGDGQYCNSYTLPTLTFGQYFTGENGTGTELFPGMSITTSQTVHLYYLSPEPPFCAIDLGFDVEIIPSPEVDSLPTVFDCTAYTLPNLSNGTYYDAANGMGNEIAPGTVITETQTIYIYAQNGICTNQSSFTVFIGLEAPTSTTECVSYTLPSLAIGGYFTEPNGGGQQIPAGTVINSTQTIYVYAESQSSPNCTDNLNFTITISLPVIETPDVTSACETYVLPSIPLGNYFTGENGTGTQLTEGTVIEESQTIYIYLNNGQGCQNSVSFEVTVLSPPKIDSRSDIDGCNNYVLTDLELGNYFTGPNGTGTMLQGGDVITNSQVIYIYAEENGCSAETSFQINVFEIQADSLEDVQVCDSYILPTLTSGNLYYTAIDGPNGFGTLLAPGTPITSTQTIYIYKENQIRPAFSCIDQTSFTVTVYETPDIAPIANVNVCNSYVLPALSVGNYFTEPNGGGTQLAEGTELTVSQTLYVYAETGTNPNCFDQEIFTVTIFNVDEVEDVTICSSYELPTLTTGRYYNGPNGTGGQLAFGSSITTSQTVYIFAQSGFSPNCSDESSFEVTIVPTPVANAVPVANRTVCEEDGTNDGVTSFDLNSLNSIVLGTQTGAEFTVAYYPTLADATEGINSITDTTLSTVYVRVNNSLAPNCFDILPITFIVHKIPEPTPIGGIVCVESETGNLLNPFTIVSGLSSSTHTFEWYLDTTLIDGATGSTLQVTEPGIYSVIATSNATGCSSEPTEVTVVASEPAAIGFTVSMAFSSTNSITINATGVGGNYEYSLDGGPFQDSPTFDNVSSGTHIVTVRDKNGCGSVTDEVLVINYPKFFTPNGDGHNETWNIVDLEEQLNAVIYIYDRYGKLLSQIYPSKNGWDGYYNGAAMPSTDYWFTVTYEENNQTKEFKSHFSLKR